ncbi:facilitated trehalose transporter Tret1-like [Hetaerina americana]|uniref:facilitated trehalose transporter Tret1-like n=1 Tax=Hetaerina americana TaxID=62018 RepID=UPI003A7F5F5D
MEEPEERVVDGEASPEEDVAKVEEVSLPEAEKTNACALIKKRSNEIMASFSAACGAFALGTTIGWTSPAVPKLNYNEEEESWIGSTLAIGAALTTFHTGFILDKLGRRLTILIQIIPFTIGWLFLAFGNQYIAMMYAGRIILGFAGGSTCMVAPTYISEISSPDMRGALGTLFQFMLTIGIFFVYGLGPFLSVMVLCITCLIWPWINVLTMIFLPESPYFLAKKNRMEAAKKAILWFRPDGNPEQELEEMQESLEVKEESIVRVMKTKPARKAALTIFMLMFFQQVSGINVVMFYSEPLFDMAKTALSGNTATIVLGLLQCIVTGIAAVIVDKTGRRLLLVVSFIGMALCQFLMAIYFHAFFPVNKANWLPLMCIYLYLIFFSIGAGPLPWTMLGELLPPASKGSVSSVAVFLNWTTAFIVTKTFHTLKNHIVMAAPFWFYGICCALGAILIFVWVPETKDKTLEQIQREFGQSDD